MFQRNCIVFCTSVCFDMSKHRPSYDFCTVLVGRKIAKFLLTRCIKKHILQGLGVWVQAASAWGVPASRAGCALMHVHLGSCRQKQAHGSYPSLPTLSLNFPGGGISLAVQPAGSEDRSELKITWGKKKKKQKENMVFFSLALCVSQMGAVGPKWGMAALKGSASWWKSYLEGQERARRGLVAHFIHTVILPHGKSPFCLKGAGKRSCVRVERKVVSAPSRQRSWVKPQKSWGLWGKKKKQYPFYFLSAVLDFKIHYTLNAYTA